MDGKLSGNSPTAVESLADREARLRAILDTAVEAIITIDPRGVIESINPSAQRMFGYSEEEAIGQNVAMLMPSPYREEHDRYLEHYHQTGEQKIIGIGREVTGRRKDGTTFPMHLAVSEVRLSTGRLYTGFIHDLTERVQMEESLRDAAAELERRVKERTRELQKAHEELIRKERLATLGQLAGGVAHEIRNPLGVIRNATYFLKQVSNTDDEDIRESLAEIDRALASSDHIVGELLDYARDPQPSHGLFAIEDVVARAISLTPLNSNVTVENRGGPDAECLGDRDQVERILLNLCSNAVQAMPNGGTLAVDWEAHDDSITVAVRDTGVGISEQHLEKVFDPLFTKKAKGIGLGLAISRRYAELNRGTIHATSHVGEGSTFFLTLPRATDNSGDI